LALIERNKLVTVYPVLGFTAYVAVLITWSCIGGVMAGECPMCEACKGIMEVIAGVMTDLQSKLGRKKSSSYAFGV